MLNPWDRQTAGLDGLKLPPVTQIGMVVPDLGAGVDFYRGFLGISKWYRTVITECRYTFRNRPIDIRLDIAVGYSGRTQVELIQVFGSDDNIYYAYPGEAGFGFHHFGVVVDDLEKAKRTMQDRGFPALQEGTLKYAGGGKTRVAYLDTMEKAGMILELIETKAFGINLGMPEWLVSLGRITGDTMTMDAGWGGRS
ncbi:MAG TPA: VOC family protein [Deltaproteobacteria bacterium]|nr:VOC family protein [Deltaproteobacteria bacterium]